MVIRKGDRTKEGTWFQPRIVIRQREAQQALSGVLSSARVRAKGRLRQEDERLRKALASRQAAGASAATRA